MTFRRKTLATILAINVILLALIASQLIWPESVQSTIYNFVQSNRRGPDETGILFILARWTIGWWFPAAISILLLSWLLTSALAIFDATTGLVERAIWGIALLFAGFPCAIVYCIAVLLRPNNSFKPNPHQGGA